MFKSGKYEDFNLEEDFLEEAFTKRKQQKQVLRSVQPPLEVSLKNVTRSDIEKNSFCASATKRSDFVSAAEPQKDIDDFGDIDWELCFAEEEEKEIQNWKKTGEENTGIVHHKIEAALNEHQHDSLTRNSVPTSNQENISTPTSLTPKQVTSWSANRSGRKRRFPGPAGLLPTQQNGSFSLPFSLDALTSDNDSESSRLKEINDSMLLSQMSENPFESDPWLQMQQDLDLNSKDAHILRKYNVAWVLQKATSRELPGGKVPILILLLKSIVEKGSEAGVVFKDETGEMPGTIHRKVFEEYEDCLLPGAVLVVRKCCVFSPNPRKHYLNVTPSNMVCLYSPNPLKPKVMVGGITHLRLQVREYALQQWMSPDHNTVEQNLPHPSHTKRYPFSHCQATVGKSKISRESETIKVPVSESGLARPVSTTTSHIHQEFEEDSIPDEELDKLLEDLENGFE